MFATVSPFQPSLCLQARLNLTRGLNSNVWLPALPPDIRLELANTLAYCDLVKFTAVKSFVVQAPVLNEQVLNGRESTVNRALDGSTYLS